MPGLDPAAGAISRPIRAREGRWCLSGKEQCAAAAHRAQADALEIEAAAKRRLADEYDRAQERGEVQRHGGQGKRDVPEQNIPSASDLGLTRKDIHEARIIRDAEKNDPGIVKRTLAEKLKAGEEPTRAKVKRAVKASPPENTEEKSLGQTFPL